MTLIVSMGLEMVEEIKRCSEFLGADLQVRIGIHCGDATAGVIGQNKFAYDLWGDTVNTASRMESHGEAGRVHISDAVYKELTSKSNAFIFEQREPLEVKGKGVMQTWFVVGKTPNGNSQEFTPKSA